MSMRFCVDLTDDRGAPTAPLAPALVTTSADPIGGKARSLLRLAQAGLRVPAAFAITDQLYQQLRRGGPPVPRALRGAGDLVALDRARAALVAVAWPSGFSDELDRHLDRLAGGAGGARFAVRSSFSGEDGGGGDGGVAAGVFESVVDVARAGVPAAIRRVLGSALSAGAIAYAQARDVARDEARDVARDEARDEPVAAVLVHLYIAGDAAGSAAIDPASRDEPVIEAGPRALAAGLRARLEDALRALAAREGGAVEIEWVSERDQLIFLQARRYQAPPAARAWGAAAELAGPDAPRWRWDAAHNPLPLSPAQAGLVALVDARCRIGIVQRVAGGYLFYAPGGAAPGETIDDADAARALAALVARVEAPLRALAERPALEEALALFTAIYDRIYGVIRPAAGRATRALADFLRAHGDRDLAGLPALYAGVPSIAVERQQRADRLMNAAPGNARAAALAAYLARFGDESPVWDVAVPTYREDTARWLALPPAPATAADAARTSNAPLPDWRTAAQAIAAGLDAGAQATFAALLEAARQARAVSEDDDWLYARAQAVVRAALLHEGERLAQRGALDAAGDVFWLPLEQVRAFAGARDQEPPPARAALDALVSAARAAYQRALQDPPQGGEDRGATSAHGALVSRGERASAGRVIGPAFVYRSAYDPSSDGARVPTPASIVVAATLLPTELPLLPAAGLVVETGGVLDHVAAQARERGIPALVGARGACASITDGDLLLLDADAGHLIRLG